MVLYAGGAVPESSGGGSTKYNITIDNIFGDVDESGVYQIAEEYDFVGRGIKDICEKGFLYKFYGDKRIKTISFPDLTKTSGNNSCYSMCEECTNLTSVDLSNLTEAGGVYFFYQAFKGCSNLISVNLSNLAKITTGACGNMFRQCSNLTSIDLSNLTTIKGQQSYMFGDTGLTEISFPKLQEVESSSLNNAFYNCKNLKIHFRADMQETVEALSGYSSKWGAKNSTIYFDL